MAQEQPPQFHMKDLFIDVKLEACVNGTTFDFLGRKLFSTEFFRQGVGFGITNIEIEVNTSLQPLITITFKDLYGLTVFGGQSRNADKDGQSHDYSVLFNWPPPKFLFSFKGYLGRPASWVLNLKRTTTNFNSSDGSYDVKCEFVPNQWGFFADLPFLYLLAVKGLKKNKLGTSSSNEQVRNVISIFDLIKIGKQVEVKTLDTTKEFDDISKQLGVLKSNIARGMTSTNIIPEGGEIIGTANNQPIKDFKVIKVPRFSELDTESKSINSKEKVEIKLGDPRELNIINTYLLLSLKVNDNDFFGSIPRNYKSFRELLETPGSNQEIETAKLNVLGVISENINKIDDEIKRRVYASSKTKLEKITIGEIFSQLAKDSAFVMGSILDAGLDGYRGDSSRQAARDELVDRGKLIGESFPLTINPKNGEEVPATKNNLDSDIGVDEFEMKFVKEFINAVSEGIAKDLITGDDVGQDDDVLKQRINNIEMTSGNPYKSYYTSIATNVLVRAGIATHFTRSDDPNRPGSYDASSGGARDDIQSIEELAVRDMQNVTPNILKGLSDVDFLLLKRFANFFSRFFAKDGNIADIKGQAIKEEGPTAADIALGTATGGISTLVAALGPTLQEGPFNLLKQGKLLDFEVVVGGSTLRFTENPSQIEEVQNQIAISQRATGKIPQEFKLPGIEISTFSTIWNELYQPSLLENYSTSGGVLILGELEEVESERDETKPETDGNSSSFTKSAQPDFFLKNAQNPLSFVDEGFTASRIVNNGIGYMYPFYSGDDYFIVLFRSDDNKKAQESNSAPSDSDLKSSDKDEGGTIGQGEILGYVPVNSKYEEDKESGTSTGELLGRVKVLKGYRDGAEFVNSGWVKAAFLAAGPAAPLLSLLSGEKVSSGGNVFDFDKIKNPPPIFFTKASTDEIVESLMWNKSILEDAFDNDASEIGRGTEIEYTGDFGFTVCSHLLNNSSGFVFDLFGVTKQARNQRVYVRKCAEILATKIREVEDEQNQIIGDVLGKAGEQENAIYKQMHTLFHQWQTLAYSDKKDSKGNLCGSVSENGGSDGGEKGRVFNVAEELERRFGSNHKDLQINEKICFDEYQLAEGDVNLTEEERQSLVQEVSGPNAGKLCLSVSNPNQASSVPDGTFIYDYPLQRIQAPEEPIDVRDSIINIEPLYKPNANTSILNIIQQICTKNNFLFIPIPGNPGYLNVRDIYSPSSEPANIQIRNFFHVLFTPTPESRTKTKNTDGTALADYSNKQKTYNVNSFVIKYGHPDNQIVSNIQVGTEDNKVTAESIVNLQRLVDNENQNKKVTTDCSMLPVLAGRSYKASVDMLGNSQCYPMQFFFLENSPLFGGLYQVMKVKHSINPNDMKTSLEGIRMRFSAGDGYGSVKPITLKTFADLGPSEAPNALSKGFDSSAREDLLKGVEISLAQSEFSGDLNLNSDFSTASVKEGNSGGPRAMSVPVLSKDALNAFDDSLGVRDFWGPLGDKDTQKIGQGQIYIIDGYGLPANTLSAYKAIKEAAAADGVKIFMNSGYRDPFIDIVHPKAGGKSQLTLRRANTPKGKNYTPNQLGDKRIPNYDPSRALGSGSFNAETAIPGRSNHNSGKAVDFNTGSKTGKIRSPLDEKVYSWLILNAWKFGFIRTVSSEEWHWEYRPGEYMFSRVKRDDKLWYGLPDKLGIPLDKPTGVAQASSPASGNIINQLESEININNI